MLTTVMALLLAGHPEAVKANTEGFRLYQRKALEPALVLFRRAVSEDDGYALAHYNLAATLSRLVTENLCAYLSADEEVLTELTRAIALDPGRRARALSDSDFTPRLGTLAFRRLLLQLDDKTSLKRLLEGTTFTSAGGWGSFGNSVNLRLLPGGKLLLGLRELKEEPFSNAVVDHPGSWTLEGHTLHVRMRRAADKAFSGEATFDSAEGSLAFPGLGKLVNYLSGACDA